MDIGDLLLGRYELLDEVGRGSTPVYRAVDRRVKREVAIKPLELSPEISREVRALAALNHPNIVTLYDVIDDGPRSYLVMELVSGETLSEILRRGPLAPEAAAAVGIDICRALEAAHAANIVHLDIKPTNVLFTQDGRLKVADFGIASLAGRRGRGFGTPEFASPEQVAGHVVDERSDIFSLACLIYTSLVGDSPFAAATGRAVLKKVREHEPPPPGALTQVPEGLDDVIMKALSKDPNERFRKAKDFRLALEEFWDGTPLSELLGLGPVEARSAPLARLGDFIASRPLLAKRAGVAFLAATAGFLLFRPENGVAAALIGGLVAALSPEAGLALVLLGAAFRIYEFSHGLAFLIAPVFVLYFVLGRLRPVVALAPVGSAILFWAGISPVFPLLAGVFLAPPAAAAVGAFGGIIDGSLFLFTGELAGLKGVTSPIVVTFSLFRSFGRSPGLLALPCLWMAVGAGLAILRRMGIAPWIAAATAFSCEAAGYYWLAGRYAGEPLGVVMRRLAFSLIIILTLALAGEPGHRRVTTNEPD